MFQIVEGFKGTLSEWWLNASFARKMGDTLAGICLSLAILTGYIFYDARTFIIEAAMSHVGKVKLNRAMIDREIREILTSMQDRGVIAITVQSVNLSENSRSIIAWAALPEANDAFERVSRSTQNVPFIGDGTYDLPTLKALIEGRASWQAGVTLPYMRLVIPLPPLYGSDTIGVLIINVKPEMALANRDALTTQGLAWAFKITR